MTRRMTRARRGVWMVPAALLLALFVVRGTGCRKKTAEPARPPEVTPASKSGWITPLLTAPPPQPTATLWRTDITRIPTEPW